MKPTMLCPNCMTTQPEIVEPQEVRCPDCGWETDDYECIKQLENYQPKCFVDRRPATHYAPVNRRFFCSGCAPRVGLNDTHKLEARDVQ